MGQTRNLQRFRDVVGAVPYNALTVGFQNCRGRRLRRPGGTGFGSLTGVGEYGNTFVGRGHDPADQVANLGTVYLTCKGNRFGSDDAGEGNVTWSVGS